MNDFYVFITINVLVFYLLLSISSFKKVIKKFKYTYDRTLLSNLRVTIKAQIASHFRPINWAYVSNLYEDRPF